MTARGYPMSDFEGRASDISVDHPAVVDAYRAAQAIAMKDAHGAADTEELRTAIVHYRALFADLLEVRAVKRDEVAHELGVSGPGSGRFLAVDAPLDVECPFLGILSAPEGLVDIFTLAPNLGAPRTRL